MQTKNINPMLCDPETGICEVPQAVKESETGAVKKPVQLLYFTDPICSSCWGIEPQLRKLQAAYGAYFDIEYKMGGLLKSWDNYGGTDVSNPTDVAQHWDEASALYEMPIDGDVWREDPLSSSYPPSIAFKAAQAQSKDAALRFLRRIKEMVFLQKKNITKWEHLQEAASESGLDVVQFEKDYHGNARAAFEEDMAQAKSLGVRGFPTIFFTDADENRFRFYGARPYAQLEQVLLAIYPGAVKAPFDTGYENIFAHFPTVTTKEFALLAEQSLEEAGQYLDKLHEEGLVNKKVSRNGALWSLTLKQLIAE